MVPFTEIVKNIAGRVQTARCEQSELSLHCFQMPALLGAEQLRYHEAKG